MTTPLRKRAALLAALEHALDASSAERREALAFAYVDYISAYRPTQSPLARDLLEAIEDGTDAGHCDVEIIAEFNDDDMREHLRMLSTNSLQYLTKRSNTPSVIRLVAENILDERRGIEESEHRN